MFPLNPLLRWHWRQILTMIIIYRISPGILSLPRAIIEKYLCFVYEVRVPQALWNIVIHQHTIPLPSLEYSSGPYFFVLPLSVRGSDERSFVRRRKFACFTKSDCGPIKREAESETSSASVPTSSARCYKDAVASFWSFIG